MRVSASVYDPRHMLRRIRLAPIRLSWRGTLAGIGLSVPIVVFAWLNVNPEANQELVLPTEHFFVVTGVSLLAASVAVLIARVALRMEQYQVTFITLGFLAIAGFFAVHALATPGFVLGAGPLAGADVSPGGPAYSAYDVPYGAGHGGHAAGTSGFDYSGTVVGLSAFLSLFIPSFLFASSYSTPVLNFARRLPFGAASVAAAVATMLVGYAVLSFSQPELIGDLPLSRPPSSYALAAVSVLLLATAAWQQLRCYTVTWLPSQGALAIAFLLLAEAQILMVVAPFWTLMWWGYHLLMLVAVVTAFGALVVELDRRRGLERYVPLELVERIVTGNVLRAEGERRVVTIMFADLRGSTSLAEQLPAEEVVKLLNTYVGTLAHCVFTHGGMLDKFLGDGLMAIFGISPDPDPSHGAIPAARSALEMRREIDSVNASRVRQGEVPVRFGVAIHSGEVVLGEIGIPQRSDFTAVGDTVNTAARLGELNKEYDVDVVLSSQVAMHLAPTEFSLRELGEAHLRGRVESVCAFTLT
jgi:class 3 adenylate cyclase